MMLQTETKICSSCKIEKPLNEFYRAAKGSLGRQGHCKQCGLQLNKEWYKNRSDIKIRDGNLQRNYGITSMEYEQILKRQGGGCIICGSRVGNKRTKFLHIDHDHSTGCIRGLLCSRCNTGLGLFHENPELLRAALDYLS